MTRRRKSRRPDGRCWARRIASITAALAFLPVGVAAGEQAYVPAPEATSHQLLPGDELTDDELATISGMGLDPTLLGTETKLKVILWDEAHHRRVIPGPQGDGGTSTNSIRLRAGG